MSGFPEPLESFFQQVERETERRAREELAQNELGASSEFFKTVDSSATYRDKRRRRGSISFSRLGQLPDDRPKSSQGLARAKRVSTIAEESPFYQAHKNDSVNTFSSGGSVRQDIEDDHSTQIQITMPKGLSKTMHAFLPRRLYRSRSVGVVPSRDANMVIGVAIEKATVESAKGDESSQANVHIGRSLRKQPSTLSMSASSLAGKGWVAKAKEFTRRFRRTKNASGLANSIPP